MRTDKPLAVRTDKPLAVRTDKPLAVRTDKPLAPAATPAVRGESPHSDSLPKGEGKAPDLKAGEPVIVEGGYSLPDGTNVTVEPPPADHRGSSGGGAKQPTTVGPDTGGRR